MESSAIRVVALLVALTGFAGCSGDAAPTGAPTPSSSAGSTKGPPEIVPFHRIPPVTGLIKDAATERLVARGFRVRAYTAGLSACVKDELVLWQRPPGGYARRVGTRVALYVSKRPRAPACGLGLPPPGDEVAQVGRAFIDFARGVPVTAAPASNPVDLYLGGHLLHTIPPERAGQRSAYGWLCPSAGSYAARVCPFSAVRAIARYPGRMAIMSQPPQHPCMHDRTIAGSGIADTVTLTPDEPRDCTNYFAVELMVDDGGQVTAVNLVASEP